MIDNAIYLIFLERTIILPVYFVWDFMNKFTHLKGYFRNTSQSHHSFINLGFFITNYDCIGGFFFLFYLSIRICILMICFQLLFFILFTFLLFHLCGRRVYNYNNFYLFICFFFLLKEELTLITFYRFICLILDL